MYGAEYGDFLKKTTRNSTASAENMEWSGT